MKQALLLLCLLTVAPTDSKLTKDDRTRFLITAVYEGLLEDGPEASVLEPIVKNSDQYFVAKCPICWPVIDGLAAYLSPRMYPLSGSGFPEQIRIGLRSPERAARLKAIEAMVDRYVARKFERTVMTAEDKTAMKNLLLMGKKEGTTMKQASFGEFCPSCTGACKR